MEDIINDYKKIREESWNMSLEDLQNMNKILDIDKPVEKELGKLFIERMNFHTEMLIVMRKKRKVKND